jgi:general secretion pathway protein L
LQDALLIFPGREGGFDRWLRLAGGAVVARGDLVEEAPHADAAVVGVVPGEAVALHWLELPGDLTVAQAVAAARLLAADVSAQPMGEMHVAAGATTREDGLRCIALVPALTMAEWMGRFEAAGADPARLVPETLLLPEPGEGVLHHGRLFRSRSDAFAMEPELAAHVLGEAEIRELDEEEFEAGLPLALEMLPVDLRQGAFARRRRWRIDWRRVRRLIALGITILAVSLLLQIVAIWRYVRAADAAETEVAQIAASTVPGRGESVGDLDRRLAELRGGGVGYSAIVSAMFAAIQATANAELSALALERDGTLRATVQADGAATLDALVSRLEGSGFNVVMGARRSGGGREVAELNVSAGR